MKKYLIVFLFSFCFAQQKGDGRFQIVQVEKISGSEYSHGNVTKPQTATATKTIILLDTQTGRAWVLSPVSSEIDSMHYSEDYQWIPISFYKLRGVYDKSIFLPPK